MRVFGFLFVMCIFNCFQTFPIIFVLMTRKTEECYTHILQFIDANIFPLKCKSFMTDFEIGMRNALRTLYPGSEFFTCWFHLTQAAERNLSKISVLVKLIQTNGDARKIYKKLLALPLLPADRIVAAFHKLKIQALSNFKQFKPFLVYFERQWLQRVSFSYFIAHIFVNLRLKFRKS